MTDDAEPGPKVEKKYELEEAWLYWRKIAHEQRERREGLDKRIRQSIAKVAAMTDDERDAMIAEQAKSFARAICEHGDPDFETCHRCRAEYEKSPASRSQRGECDSRK
jgi:hypothetical protein